MTRSKKLSKLERCSGWALLLNAGLGLAVGVGTVVAAAGVGGLLQSAPWVSLFGVVAGALALRGSLAGLAGGALFYGLQVASYYSRDFQFNFKSGISLGAVIELPHGVLVLNMAALTGLAVILLVLARRRASPSVRAPSKRE